MTTSTLDIERLEEIREEIEQLVREAQDELRQNADAMIFTRADAYWISHITGALDGSTSIHSFDDTLQELLTEPIDADDDIDNDDDESEVL